ncbi:sulfur carrier protein ThiS [Amphritea balenae]|uniref:Sulfur carrier protein ThiS n=1 Tax=Amphritea balenae TaxID=452629 RepID=A0A3P1SQH8_9GAMM|nr:sulfur carrier protein ThiS [Amphritea balenae]RRC99373.1 sulfur carrier protein ThiS [Amphritea balenae]GGK71662.1 sulfur carrier protein ThiS [Amphritea balenae]
MMIRLTVNGEKLQQVTARNLQELIETLRLTEKRIAVEVNQEIIPRSEHQSTRLREGDRVEIVRAVGGG